MVWTVMPEYESYQRAREDFLFELPKSYNPAVDLLRKHEDTSQTALYQVYADRQNKKYSFDELDTLSSRLANSLSKHGIEPGEKVGVVVPQKVENPITHIASWKLGAVSVPLSVLFGKKALKYRLNDADVSVAVIDPSVRQEFEELRAKCDSLDEIIMIGSHDKENFLSFDDQIATSVDSDITVYDSEPGTDTVIMYTSGSTGPPKGVLHSHALWLGRAAAAYNYFDQDLNTDSVVWTPADWAWGAALGGTLFATWHHGGTVVGYPFDGFDENIAFDLLETYDVSEAFIPATALRMLMRIKNPVNKYNLSLSTISVGGEPLTPEIIKWVRNSLDNVNINEFYGQTELNLVVGNNSKWFDTKPGSMGKPLPGYEVAILNPEAVSDGRTERMPVGETGEIAIQPRNRDVFFNEYRNMPEKTSEKQVGDWFLTGDIASKSKDGYVWFKSRKDDVIITSGYRVGPMEVEEAILEHPDAQQAGVIGVPDRTRGEIIKAFIKTTPGSEDDNSLKAEIRELVRERLAEYEYPREIEFIKDIPQTTTGKIRRLELREMEADND